MNDKSDNATLNQATTNIKIFMKKRFLVIIKNMIYQYECPFLYKFSYDQKGRDSNEVKRERDHNLKRFVRLNCFHKLCSITN